MAAQKTDQKGGSRQAVNIIIAMNNDGLVPGHSLPDHLTGQIHIRQQKGVTPLDPGRGKKTFPFLPRRQMTAGKNPLR